MSMDLRMNRMRSLFQVLIIKIIDVSSELGQFVLAQGQRLAARHYDARRPQTFYERALGGGPSKGAQPHLATRSRCALVQHAALLFIHSWMKMKAMAQRCEWTGVACCRSDR